MSRNLNLLRVLRKICTSFIFLPQDRFFFYSFNTFLIFVQRIFLAICQIRLDFDTVQTVAPILAIDGNGNGIGSCTSDTIAFTSPSGKNPPTYCGDISGTHSK